MRWRLNKVKLTYRAGQVYLVPKVTGWAEGSTNHYPSSHIERRQSSGASRSRPVHLRDTREKLRKARAFPLSGRREQLGVSSWEESWQGYPAYERSLGDRCRTERGDCMEAA